jgi:hypothetical protein
MRIVSASFKIFNITKSCFSILKSGSFFGCSEFRFAVFMDHIHFREEQCYFNCNALILFCLIRRILLFGLAQKVNKKPKAA